MSDNALTLARGDKSAEALVRHERSTSKVRYAQYVSDHDVTVETLPAHVQALANLAGEIRKWESAAERKAFCTKIRNGLKFHLVPAVEESSAQEEGSEEGEGEGEGSEETPATVDPLQAVLTAVEAALKAGLDKDAIVSAISAL
jgi:hypothetical protein